MAEYIELTDLEISALNKFPEASFKEFILLIFEFIINSKNSEKILVDLENFCSEIGANLGGIKSLVTSFLSFLRDATKRSLSQDIIFDRLQKRGKCKKIFLIVKVFLLRVFTQTHLLFLDITTFFIYFLHTLFVLKFLKIKLRLNFA